MWLDALRVVAAFAVICLHASVSVVVTDPRPDSLNWWIGNVTESSVRWSVPVFVMISGGLILPRAREQPIVAFYRRRLPRVCIPLLFWSIFYAVYSWVRFGSSARQLTYQFATGAPYFHLWFLFALAGLYLAAPFLARFLDALTRPQQWAAMGGMYLAFTLHEAVMAMQYRGHDAFDVWLPYVPYFVLGSFLVGTAVPGRRVVWAIVFVGSVAVIAAVTGVLLPLLGLGRALNLMYGNLNPLVALSAVSVVALAQAARIGPSVAAAIERVAPVTLGIYLIHPLWLEATTALGIVPLNPRFLTPAVGIPVVAGGVFVLSYVSCLLVRTLPGGRHLVT